MKDFKSSVTGNRIIINCASWREAIRLKTVILQEFKRYNVGIKLSGADAIDVLDREVDTTGILDFIKNTIISIETSPEFYEALFDCLKYCTYKTTFKINEELFDNDSIPEAREDYYEIMYACIEENLRPFMKSLVSVWKNQLSTNKLFQTLNVL